MSRWVARGATSFHSAMLVLLGASIAACGDSSTPHDTSADDTLADTSDLTDETAPDTSDSSAETSDAQDDTTEVEAFTCTNTSDCQGYFGPLGACQLASCNTSTGRCIRSNKFDGTPCNDFDSCTTDDGCRSGACIGATAVNCDDGRACTTDSCDRRLGCQNVVREGACDDGNRCTANDQCAPNAKCLGSPVVCDDDNVCTADRCEPATGCVYTPLDPCPAEAR